MTMLACLKAGSLNEMYLVSGGGRAQLKVWKMTFDNDDHFEKRVIHVREVGHHMLKGTDKLRKKKTWKTSDALIPGLSLKKSGIP